MGSSTITFRVDDAERVDLVVRAEREKVSLSDYIRVRLGLRGEGPQGDGGHAVAATDEGQMRALLADHESRLEALEANRAAGAGT